MFLLNMLFYVGYGISCPVGIDDIRYWIGLGCILGVDVCSHIRAKNS